MQTILGAGGDIGIPLAKALKTYTDKIRLVSRKPKKVNETDELLSADITSREAVFNAVKGSAIVYLTVGYEYKLKIWKQLWPLTMQNVIDACLQHNAKLVFFDNVYLYSKNEMSHIIETSTIDPPSKKGKVRAEIVQMLWDAVRQKGLKALVARSADFYGGDTRNSVFKLMVLDKLRLGKKAIWMSDANKIHTFTYIPDAAKATALLGNTENAFGQTWHLPTSSEKLTGRDYIRLSGEIMGIIPKIHVMSKTTIKLLGLFVPILNELEEMQYQNDRDYFFDSSKFENYFQFKTTAYRKGITEAMEQNRK